MLDAVDAKRHKVGRHARRQNADVVAAEDFRAAEDADFQRFARGHAIGLRFESGPADALQQHGLAHFAQHVVAVVAGRAVQAQAHLHAAIEHGAHRRDARGEDHFGRSDGLSRGRP